MTIRDFSFDWTIAPHSPETFFTDYFEKKPLLIKRGQGDYYRDLLNYAEIDRVITTMGLSHPEINVTKHGGSITPPDFTYEHGLIDPVRVTQLFADGATVILSGLHDRLPQLARFCRAVEAVFSCRVQTNIYMTPTGNQGFRAHYDSHCVLVLQVEGTKEWRLYDTPVELPLNTQGFDPHNVPVGAETDRFVLEPGDMLYVPRGLAHDAVATDETSVHITTGLMVRTWADVMAEAVNVMAHEDPVFRHALPPGYANQGADLTAYADRFTSLLARLGDAPVAKLLAGFRQDFLTNRLPRVEGQLAQIARLSGLSVDDEVGPRPDLIYALDHLEEDGLVRLVAHGTEIVLPDHAADALRYCIGTPAFRLGDMAGDLDDAGKLVLVRRLVREGMMMIR